MSALVQPAEIHRLTIPEYRQMIASGGFDGRTRVELIDGLVVDMSPRPPQHEAAIRWLLDWLVEHLDHARYQFMIAGSMTIGGSEPEPDVAIFERPAPTREHPSQAVLVIEVAVSSRDRDLRSKPQIYPGAVDEYWVVDLERQLLVVHRGGDPSGYRDIQEHARGVEATPASLPLHPLITAGLFATALGERD
ncbi:MAG: Uma2 family endonuclease [Solirubrobacteraceae bacterium]